MHIEKQLMNSVKRNFQNKAEIYSEQSGKTVIFSFYFLIFTLIMQDLILFFKKS